MNKQEFKQAFDELITSEELFNTMLNSRTFKTNMHLLANRTNKSDRDAELDLFIQSLERFKMLRLHAADLIEKLRNEDEEIGWLITYAQRTLSSKHFEKNKREKNNVDITDVVDEAEFVVGDSYGDAEIDEAVNMAKALFARNSADFVLQVLEIGRDEYMNKHQINGKVFNSRFANAKRTAGSKLSAKKREKYLKKQATDELTKHINQLNAIVSILETDSDLSGIDAIVASDLNYFDELIFRAKVHKPVAMLKAFSKCELKDQYKFSNQVYDTLDELNNKLNKLN